MKRGGEATYDARLMKQGDESNYNARLMKRMNKLNCDLKFCRSGYGGRINKRKGAKIRSKQEDLLHT